MNRQDFMTQQFKKLKKAEAAARKAQEARDRAQKKWEEAHGTLFGQPEWDAYCEYKKLNKNYNFGDILC